MKTKKRSNMRFTPISAKVEEFEAGPNIARKLDVDPATVRRYAREGMPHHILGEGMVRYKWTEVLDWLARRPKKSKKQQSLQPAQVAKAGVVPNK